MPITQTLAFISENKLIELIAIIGILALVWWFIVWVGTPAPVQKVLQVCIAVAVIGLGIHYLYGLL